jgi:hypothetical protein
MGLAASEVSLHRVRAIHDLCAYMHVPNSSLQWPKIAVATKKEKKCCEERRREGRDFIKALETKKKLYL